MTELLVILACTQGQGCSQSASAYYSSAPQVKAMANHHTAKFKEMVGPEIVAFYPLILLVGRGRATINLDKNYSLQLSNRDNSALFLYKYSF